MESEDHGWVIIPQCELDKNDYDPGFMFCEDCHEFHFITYRKCLEEDDREITRTILGFYFCKDVENLWSINGKRID